MLYITKTFISENKRQFVSREKYFLFVKKICIHLLLSTQTSKRPLIRRLIKIYCLNCLNLFVYMHQYKNMLIKLQLKRLKLTEIDIKPIKLFIVVKPV